jgi:hypothetical protein
MILEHEDFLDGAINFLKTQKGELLTEPVRVNRIYFHSVSNGQFSC